MDVVWLVSVIGMNLDLLENNCPGIHSVAFIEQICGSGLHFLWGHGPTQKEIRNNFCRSSGGS